MCCLFSRGYVTLSKACALLRRLGQAPSAHSGGDTRGLSPHPAASLQTPRQGCSLFLSLHPRPFPFLAPLRIFPPLSPPTSVLLPPRLFPSLTSPFSFPFVLLSHPSSPSSISLSSPPPPPPPQCPPPLQHSLSRFSQPLPPAQGTYQAEQEAGPSLHAFSRGRGDRRGRMGAGRAGTSLVQAVGWER